MLKVTLYHCLFWLLFGILDFTNRENKSPFYLEFIFSIIFFYTLSYLLKKQKSKIDFPYVGILVSSVMVETVLYLITYGHSLDLLMLLKDKEIQKRVFLHFDQIIKVMAICVANSMYLYNLYIQKDIFENLEKTYLIKKRILSVQIDNHFIYNALNMIYSRTLNVSHELGDEIIVLSDLLRKHLNSSNIADKE